MKNNKISVINFIQFQIIWFLCVLYKNQLLLVSVVVFFSYLALLYQQKMKHFSQEIRLILACATIGYTVDTLLSLMHIFSFPETGSLYYFPPIWLGMIWLAFASTINASMRYFRLIHPVWQAMLGGILGPAVYLFSVKYSGIVLPDPKIKNYLIWTLCWAFMFPLFFYLRKKIIKDNQ